MRPAKQSGFSLIELLLVLAMVGILSAIAIPRFLGARDLARQVAEGEAQFRIIAMQLESTRAESGLYPAAGAYSWAAGSPPAAPLPGYTPPTGTPLQWDLVINADRQTYTVTVRDTRKGKNISAFDQTGNSITFTP